MPGFRSFRLLLLLTLAAGAGAAVATAGRQEAALLPGTYYVDLFQAVEQTPGFADTAAKAMAPLKTRGDQITAEEKDLEDAISALQLMDQNSLEYAQKKARLSIQEQALNEEKNALVQLRDRVREQVMAAATLNVHRAVEEVAKVKGYEAVILMPLPLSEVADKGFGAAMELLRQRDTLWIHPSRDITAEVIAHLTEQP